MIGSPEPASLRFGKQRNGVCNRTKPHEPADRPSLRSGAMHPCVPTRSFSIADHLGQRSMDLTPSPDDGPPPGGRSPAVEVSEDQRHVPPQVPLLWQSRHDPRVDVEPRLRPVYWSILANRSNEVQSNARKWNGL